MSDKITYDVSVDELELIQSILSFVELDIEFDTIQLSGQEQSIFTSLVDKTRGKELSFTLTFKEISALISSINYVLHEIDSNNMDADVQVDYFPNIDAIRQLKTELSEDFEILPTSDALG